VGKVVGPCADHVDTTLEISCLLIEAASDACFASNQFGLRIKYGDIHLTRKNRLRSRPLPIHAFGNLYRQ
jgi:hypothetical protein